MGTNTLNNATDGTIIPSADHNSLVEALKNDLVPRDTTTLIPDDLGGNLGQTSYRWNAVYTKLMNIGTVANGHSIDETGTRLDINAKASMQLQIDNVAVTDIDADGINGAGIKDASIPREKMSALNYQESSSSGTYSTTSTSFVAVTNLTATITTNGNKVRVMLVPDGSANNSLVGSRNDSVASSIAGFSCQIKRASTVIANYRNSGFSGFTTGFTFAETPASGFEIIDSPVAGTYTYTFNVASFQTFHTTYIQYCKLIAYEL